MTIRISLGGKVPTTLCSQFAAVRVRVALGQQKREPEWLLIEWPQSDAVPAKYWLSNLPEDTSLTTLVATAKGRWRIERDCQELKQAFGLKHYEDWRGFHYHATLCTVAYGFLVMEHLRGGDQKKSDHAKQLPYPKATGRGVIKRAQRHVVNSIATLRWELKIRRS